MKYLILLSLFFAFGFTSNAQKKHWISSKGSFVKKENATEYFTYNKIKKSKSVLVKFYLKYAEFPYKELTCTNKDMLENEGPYRLFHKDGSVNIEGQFLNNKRDGEWKTYDRSNRLTKIMTFKNDLHNGISITYIEKGGYIKGNYINDDKDSVWNYYKTPEVLSMTETYKKGMLNGETKLYYEDGVFKEISIYENNRLLSNRKYDSEGNEVVLSTSINDSLYITLDQPPVFPGGQSKMMKFLSRNVKYPPQAMDNNVQGRAYISFTIEKDGSITDVKTAAPKGREVHKLLLNEALRVVKSMPKWTPGMHEGEVVRVKFVVPISFKLR